MRKVAAIFAISALVLGVISSASATPVSWTDWTSATTTTASGTLDVNGNPVTVSVTDTAAFAFTQVNGTGTNYWNPSAPYLSAAVSNAPPGTDIIALNTGGTVTIDFSAPVLDPLIALVSWNSNVVDFGVPIDILSFGQGYWGNGTPILNAGGTGFTGSGEVHGVIELPGTYSSISFTNTSENWHGFTVGVVGLADGNPNPAPEPATLALFGFGLAGLAATRRRKQ